MNAAIQTEGLAKKFGSVQALSDLYPRCSGVLFPSVVGTDANLVIYVQNCRRASLAILNTDELREKVKEMALRLRGTS